MAAVTATVMDTQGAAVAAGTDRRRRHSAVTDCQAKLGIDDACSTESQINWPVFRPSGRPVSAEWAAGERRVSRSFRWRRYVAKVLLGSAELMSGRTCANGRRVVRYFMTAFGGVKWTKWKWLASGIGNASEDVFDIAVTFENIC